MREFIREPEAIFWAFVFPIVMSLALALAFPSRASRPVLVGLDPGAATESLRATLTGSRGITHPRRAAGDDAARFAKARSTSSSCRRRRRPIASTRRAKKAVSRGLVVDDALKRAAGRADPWTAREEPQEVAGSRYIDWFIPGLIGMGIMSNGMWGIGFAIVQARMRKLLKRLVASPMRRSEYLLAQMFARLVFLPPEVVVPLAFGVLAFGMPINGSRRRDRRRRADRGAVVWRRSACCWRRARGRSRRFPG